MSAEDRTRVLPETIQRFLAKSKVAGICFREQDRLHAVNCLFAHDPVHNLLVMKSAEGSGHDAFVYSGDAVAGTILPDMISVSGLHGLQFGGFTVPRGSVRSYGSDRLYHQKFPFTRYLPGYTWAISLSFVKFTDNRVRFGQKLIWGSR